MTEVIVAMIGLLIGIGIGRDCSFMTNPEYEWCDECPNRDPEDSGQDNGSGEG